MSKLKLRRNSKNAKNKNSTSKKTVLMFSAFYDRNSVKNSSCCDSDHKAIDFPSLLIYFNLFL
jgi:hypothetical protein